MKRCNAMKFMKTKGALSANDKIKLEILVLNHAF